MTDTPEAGGTPGTPGMPVPQDAPTCYRHPGRETGVRCSRCDRPICPACMVPAAVGFQCPECVQAGRRSVRPTRTMYGGRAGGRGEMTKLLVGANVAIFIVTIASGANVLTGQGTSTLYDRFALIPPAVANGGWYRLVSSMFLHFGFIHIAFNMWALWVLGMPLEVWLGRIRFVALYFLAGIGGGVLSFAFGPVSELAAGASGAIFGLFGAFYVIARRRRLETGPIVGIIALNLVLSFTFSNIDWRGHVGGLVVGALVAVAFAWAPEGPNRDRVQAAGCVVVAVILVASGFAAAAHVRHECRTAVGAAAVRCFDAGLTPGQ